MYKMTDSETEVQKTRLGLVLAAGNGIRMKKSGISEPKALLRVGGLSLVERTILTLYKAGLERIRVVLGANAQKIRTAIETSKNLQEVPIEFVYCEDYELGNGATLAAGTNGLHESFVLTMVDHVTIPDMIKQLIQAGDQNPQQPHLLVDNDPDSVFDLDDATKVLEQEGNIKQIGKDLNDYNSVDTGLFWMPKSAIEDIQTAKAQGANSVSNIVEYLLQKGPFVALTAKNPIWQDVDNPDMAKQAERVLLKSLPKPTDGLVSKYLNRPVSIQVSRYLARIRFSPNWITTVVTAITLIGAVMATSSNYWWVLGAGIVFHVASILDGCDGEVSRLAYMGSHYGAWYDTLSDNFRYVVFILCLGISGYKITGSELYLWGMALFAIIAIFAATTMARYVFKTQDHLTNLAVTAAVEQKSQTSSAFWDRFIVPLKVLIKQDVIAFLVLLFCVAGYGHYFLWGALFGAVLMTISIVRALGEQEQNQNNRPNSKGLLFLLIGAAILGLLITKMPFAESVDIIKKMGPAIGLVFFVAPLWIVANTQSLVRLTKNRVRFIDLLFNQLAGEAINTILFGVGGEAFKIKHLSRWLPISDATHSIVRDRIVHIASGVIFSIVMLLLGLIYAPIQNEYAMGMGIAAGLLGLFAIVMMLLLFFKLPTRLTKWVLARFNVTEEAPAILKRDYAIALFWKVLGRSLNLVEVWLLFILVGIEPNAGYIFTAAAFLSMSGTIFFVIPQGLGVAEAGVSAAFAILGLAHGAGLAFGLVRRARILFWTLTGLSSFIPGILFRKKLQVSETPAK